MDFITPLLEPVQGFLWELGMKPYKYASKALSKQEGQKICWYARFLNPLFFFKFESAACWKNKD
jgi:hypothetical protein